MTEKKANSESPNGDKETIPSCSSSEEGEEGVSSLEEARKIIRDLRERHRAQAYQILAWRRRVKHQEDLINRINKERKEQLRKVSSQLLLFEARLSRKQREISLMLSQREVVIAKQQRTIRELQTKLKEAGLVEESCTNLDSLNDSDSAVIMEDEDGVPSGAWVGVARSVSDAKYALLRRSSGMFLRRPEVLETVYSVEEDPDADANSTTPQSSHSLHEISNASKLRQIGGSFEYLDPPPLAAYNRVMSNHRSVTKPKDVKYKRINKAKSKSLEELRGRLMSWVDKGHKITTSVDQ